MTRAARGGPGAVVLALCCSPEPGEVALDRGTYSIDLDTAAPEWGGPTPARCGPLAGKQLELAPWSAVLLTRR